MFELYLRIIAWIRRHEGQDLVEYALLMGFLSLVAVVAIVAGGTKISQLWSYLAAGLGSITLP